MGRGARGEKGEILVFADGIPRQMQPAGIDCSTCGTQLQLAQGPLPSLMKPLLHCPTCGYSVEAATLGDDSSLQPASEPLVMDYGNELHLRGRMQLRPGHSPVPETACGVIMLAPLQGTIPLSQVERDKICPECLTSLDADSVN